MKKKADNHQQSVSHETVSSAPTIEPNH